MSTNGVNFPENHEVFHKATTKSNNRFVDQVFKVRRRKYRRSCSSDHPSTNAYFITVCVKEENQFFGEIRNGTMVLSDIGNAASSLLQQMAHKPPKSILDEFMIMPNHLHCIIDITRNNSWSHQPKKFSRPLPGSVSMLMNHYKGELKKWCNRNGYCEFEWQERFSDHVIRDEVEYWEIKRYIRTNPKHWKEDRFFRSEI
jgi:putative transposase